MAQFNDGYLVWESNRTGRFRLWIRNLDGSGLRQLSPEEEDRNHFSPHISPDGQRVVYLSYPAQHNAYEKHTREYQVPMHLIDMESTEDRILVPDARSYFENRAAVWVNDHKLIYIAGDGRTQQLNLRTGATILLTEKSHEEFGWLIDPTMTYATSGEPTFSLYNPGTRSISPRKQQEGCQPYFSQNGVWGYWMGGAGGPIRRCHLASGRVSEILTKNDPRLPVNRRYLYFPMLSNDESFLAFGASPNQHDHHTADYDIFAIPTDPQTLEITGEPVRYTFHPGVDRFPSVFIRELELGHRSGEAPFTVTYTTPDAEDKWQWDLGDGKVKKGEKIKYTSMLSGMLFAKADFRLKR